MLTTQEQKYIDRRIRELGGGGGGGMAQHGNEYHTPDMALATHTADHGKIITSSGFDEDEVVATTLAESTCGILIVGIGPDLITAVFRLDGGILTFISADVLFSKIKDLPNQYNCYFEGGFFKVQNKVADGKTLNVSVYGA